MNIDRLVIGANNPDTVKTDAADAAIASLTPMVTSYQRATDGACGRRDYGSMPTSKVAMVRGQGFISTPKSKPRCVSYVMYLSPTSVWMADSTKTVLRLSSVTTPSTTLLWIPNFAPRASQEK